VYHRVVNSQRWIRHMFTHCSVQVQELHFTANFSKRVLRVILQIKFYFIIFKTFTRLRQQGLFIWIWKDPCLSTVVLFALRLAVPQLVGKYAFLKAASPFGFFRFLGTFYLFNYTCNVRPSLYVRWSLWSLIFVSKNTFVTTLITGTIFA
jgi:hypothetical protein